MDRNLKSLRKSADLKQTDVASALHVSKQTVNKWEMGRAPVARKHWSVLASMLRVTEYELESVLVETLLAACIEKQDARPLLNAQTSRLYGAELIANALSRFGGAAVYPNNPRPAKEQTADIERERLDFERAIFERDKKIFELEKKLEDLRREVGRMHDRPVTSISSALNINELENEVK